MKIHKFLILLLYPCIFLHANIYGEYKLHTQTDNNYFISTNFEEIIRFNPLEFNPTSLKEKSSKYINEITNTILEYKNNRKDLVLTIIGHSHSGDKDLSKSEHYAQEVQSYFKNHGIDSNLTVIEARGSKDPLFSSDNSLSNRVMVTMYIKEDLDKDKDGVLKDKDNCPNTQLGVKVSQNGCKIATIIMLMDNHKKENAILVKTGKQELLLDEPNTYTSVQSKNAMSEITKMSDEEKNSLFGNVLASSKNEHFTFTLYFEKTSLDESSKKQLDEIIKIISKKNDYYIKVTGHTDTKGSSTSNKKLSQERVNVILTKIKENNLKYLTLLTESYGEEHLAIPTADNINEPLNRRVEILIH